MQIEQKIIKANDLQYKLAKIDKIISIFDKRDRIWWNIELEVKLMEQDWENLNVNSSIKIEDHTILNSLINIENLKKYKSELENELKSMFV